VVGGEFFAGRWTGAGFADAAALADCAIADQCGVKGGAGAVDAGGEEPVCGAAADCAGAYLRVLGECAVSHGESSGAWKHVLPEGVARGRTGVWAELRGFGGAGSDEACREVRERGSAAGGSAVLPFFGGRSMRFCLRWWTGQTMGSGGQRFRTWWERRRGRMWATRICRRDSATRRTRQSERC